MPEIGEGLPHLLVSRTASTELYTTPKRPRGGGLNLPTRNRQQHAQGLFEKLTRVREESEALKQQRTAFGSDALTWIYLQFLVFTTYPQSTIGGGIGQAAACP
jgi:hypothetical protein